MGNCTRNGPWFQANKNAVNDVSEAVNASISTTIGWIMCVRGSEREENSEIGPVMPYITLLMYTMRKLSDKFSNQCQSLAQHAPKK